MMAEMIATYPSPGASPGVAATAPDSVARSQATSGAPAQDAPDAAGGGYLNEVRAR